MLEAAKAFIVRTTDCRSPALLIFRLKLAVFRSWLLLGFNFCSGLTSVAAVIQL
jgi:hypothetical protein